jgi:hypothetical protein
MFIVVPQAEAVLEMADHLARWLGAGQTILVHLYTNNLVPSNANVLTDYVELTAGAFPGYAAALTGQVGTPFLNGAGNVEQTMQDVQFQPSADPAGPVTIYGFFLTLHPVAGPDTLLGGCRFDAPPVISSHTQAVVVDPDVICAPVTSQLTQ